MAVAAPPAAAVLVASAGCVGLTIRQTATGPVVRRSGARRSAHSGPSGTVGFLAWNRAGSVLYCAGESGLTAARRSTDGQLHSLGPARATVETPCQISVSGDGRFLLSALYETGRVTVHDLEADGSIGPLAWSEQLTGNGPVAARQSSAHAHQVLPLPDGRLLVTDLGADRLLLYDLDAGSGRLTRVGGATAAPGSGPRHATTGGDDRVYVAGELDSSVGVYRYDAAAASLRLLSRCPSLGVLAKPDGNYPSEIATSPDARFVYVANRGTDLITVLAVDGDQLEIVADVPSGGRWAQHFAVLDSYLVVANQKSDLVTVFHRNGASGMLTPTGASAEVSNPRCVVAAPMR
jgi:6-phosphogluconolactonase